jgi:hypothetical protein
MTWPSVFEFGSNRVRVGYGAGLRVKPGRIRIAKSIAVSDRSVLEMV